LLQLGEKRGFGMQKLGKYKNNPTWMVTENPAGFVFHSIDYKKDLDV
jgi:hypothetical protein